MPVKFSIIVPVFNSEKYLSKCLDSLINGIKDDVELIVINDGSTDHSLNICKRYQSHYKHIVVIDTENGGVSNARNLGLKEAKGEYIIFIDSDDFVSDNFYKSIEEIVSYPADIYLTGYNVYVDHSIKKISANFDDGYYKNVNALHDNLFQIMEYQIWNKIFLREIIVKNNIQFDPSLVTSEDLAFWVDYFMFVTRIYCASAALYNYRINNSGAVRSPKLVYIRNISDVFKRQIELLDNLQASKNAYVNLSIQYIEHISLIVNMCISAGFDRNEIKKVLREENCLNACSIQTKKISANFKYICLKFNFYELLYLYFTIKGDEYG